MRNDIFVPSKATFKVSFGGGVTLKALSAAVLASCFSFGAQQTFAADISNVDLTKQPLSSPTLDYLNKQGVEFKDESGNVLKDYSSSYTLTKVNSPSDNTITKYEINRATGEITGEQSYKVDFKSATSVDDYVDKYTDVVSGNNSNTPLFENPTGIVADSINQRVYKNNTSSTKVSSNSDFGTYAQIVNNGDISDINADFVGNTASVNSSSSTAWRYFYGNASGAIYNNGNINNISGDFIGNSFSSSRVYLWGAKTASAILNDYNGEISNIKGNFVDNYGGAINNAGTIGNILGSFVNNDSGAIYNSGKISNIVGDFYRSSIENSGEISNIVGDFINSANNYNYGAITNYNNDNDDTGYIGNIVGNFFNNAYGAILNYSVINNVTGYFAGNGYYSYNGGGAIKNSGYINVTNSTFVENTSENNGGAIYSGFNESIYSGSIPEGKSAVKATETFNTNVKSSIFTNNKVSYGSGGAIALSYNIDFYSGERPIPVSLDSDISNNTDNSSIINKFKESISVNIEDSIFNENMAQYAGGAIAAYGRITEYQDSYSYGPSSLNIETASSSDNVSVLNIKNSKFINNIVEDWYEPKYTLASYATYEAYGNDTFSAQYGGGAIWTNVATKIENSLFDGNKTINGNGGAIFADVEDYQIYNNGWGPAEENLSDTSGIALMSEGVSPQTNYVVYENGATPTQSNGLTIKNSSFINNTASSDLEVQTPEAWDYINYLENFGDYETANNLYDLLDAEAEKRGYDIENGNYPPADIQDEIINKIVGSTQEFKDFVKMAEEAQKAHGGAIYSAQNTQIIADNADVIFKNNKVVNNGKETLNDIYMLTSIGNKQSAMAGNIVATANDEIRDLVTLTLDARNGGSIVLNGTIDGGIVTYPQRNTSMDQSVLNADTNISNDSKTDFQPAYNLNITGDGTGNVVFGNSVKNASITTFNGSNASLTKDSNWNNNILTMQGGQISMINNEVGTMNLQRMLVTKDTNLLVDVDLAKNTMDTIKSKDYSEHFGNVNVSGMNLLSDAKNEKTEIYFAEQGLKDNVTNGTGELPDQNQTAYTPIYKYNVSYDNREDGGYFVFNRGGSAGNPSDSFNPSILATPVSSVAASQATINETFKYVFEHADAFTQLPQSIRLSRLNANKYALNETNPYGLGSSTDFDGNRGSLCYEHNNKAGWFRPYATFENMHLKNGPKVNATTYGSLAGFDTDFKEHKNGWYSVGTGYIGYNGSQLSYSGVDTTMNGGILGYTHTRYKGNFWTALTLSAGASVGQSRTMYGKEDFTSLMAGLGSKTGYNFEFKEGKYILQPIMFMSYTFVNTFDYTNAAGVKINASPAHSIQLNPSVRFIANAKNGWQPYASVGMVWNVMNENKVTANAVRLPEMSMKPYVEYGIGIQRNWKDRFTAFGQAMLRHGGRNGVALTAGFRWAIGKDSSTEKVQNTSEKLTSARTILKQMSEPQKVVLKKQNTMTTKVATVKQL